MNSASLGGELTFRLRLQRGSVAGVEIGSTRPQAAMLFKGKTPEQAVQLAPPSEKGSYQERLALYQQETPYRLEPVANIVQASHEGQ